MHTSRASIEHTKSLMLRNAKIGLTIAAAGATAYGVGRMIYNRRSEAGQYKHRLEEWLKPRLETLSQALGTTAEMAETIAKEVQSTVHTALCTADRAHKAVPEKMDLLKIDLEKHLLKMKMKIHKLLALTETSQTEALHRFYEELRSWLIPKDERSPTAPFAASTPIAETKVQ